MGPQHPRANSAGEGGRNGLEARTPIVRSTDTVQTNSGMVGSVIRFGGGACESNTPGTLFTPHYGFEDRGGHQAPSASKRPFSEGARAVSNEVGAVAPVRSAAAP